MGAGFHGGFGNTKGAKKYIFYAENKIEALKSVSALPKRIQASFTKFVKDTTTSKYAEYKVLVNSRGYIYQSTKCGDVPGSYAVYYKEVDKDGKTLKVYKDTYDNNGYFVHRKIK